MNNHPVLPVVFLLSIIGLGTLPSPARADDGGPFSLGARAVSYTPKDGDNALYGGLQARLRLPLFFAVDASLDYREYDAGNRTVSDYPLQLSALMYVLPKIVLVQPYILGGVGWYNTTVETPGFSDETDSRFAPHLGAGLEVSLGPKWFVDANYRYVWLDEIEGIDDAGSMMTAGLNYRF